MIGVLMSVGVMTVGVMIMSVGEIIVGVMTVGVMRQPHYYGYRIWDCGLSPLYLL